MASQRKASASRQPIAMKCPLTNSVPDCNTLFAENDSDPYFKPLSDAIACHCSLFKRKLKKTTSKDITFKGTDRINEFSDGDISLIKQSHLSDVNTKLPPIIIKKYKFNSENVCPQKNYLSQLFEKCNDLFYKPVYVEPTRQSDLYDAARDNFYIESKKCTGYFGGNGGTSIDNLNKFFKTSIAYHTGGVNEFSEYANIPVFFIIEENSRVYPDYYSGPSFQFFSDVMNELVEHKVFIPNTTLFSNERYVLNMNINIEKFEFYANFPKELKTEELKKHVTAEFYRYIGNLLHFAVANNIELPFKLSRIYIMELFNLFNFTHYTPSKGYTIQTNLDEKLALISTYLLESASINYQKTIMNIFKNPIILLNNNPSLFKDPADYEWFQCLNVDDPGKPIRMNGANNLTNDDKNLYDEDKQTVLMNMVEYLYKTAFKRYFASQIDDQVFDNNFVINPNLQMFFEGFKYTSPHTDIKTKLQGQLHLSQLPIFIPPQLTHEEKLACVRKIDIYLSGFGITHETIEAFLIPKINLLSLYKNIVPITELKCKEFNLNYINNIEREPNFIALDIDTKNIIRKGVLLFKVLLSRGVDIPVDFINGYNEKMFNTTIPPQIMTMIIKQKLSSANNEIVVPADIVNITTSTKSEKKITKIVTTSDRDKDIIIPAGAEVSYTFETVSSGNQNNMTNEDYHNEFVKYLLKFWSGSPNISNNTYTMSYQSERMNAGPHDLIIAGTCFLRMSAIKKYSTEKELYLDLVKSVIHTRFGELLGGNSKRQKSRVAPRQGDLCSFNHNMAAKSKKKDIKKKRI